MTASHVAQCCCNLRLHLKFFSTCLFASSHWVYKQHSILGYIFQMVHFQMPPQVQIRVENRDEEVNFVSTLQDDTAKNIETNSFSPPLLATREYPRYRFMLCVIRQEILSHSRDFETCWNWLKMGIVGMLICWWRTQRERITTWRLQTAWWAVLGNLPGTCQEGQVRKAEAERLIWVTMPLLSSSLLSMDSTRPLLTPGQVNLLLQVTSKTITNLKLHGCGFDVDKHPTFLSYSAHLSLPLPDILFS